ncbi:energy transducer TonB [Bacteroidales bacterium OttesenSCG-928-L03]|nr:energy transducer TonB [Bacteroidales bacterium OttesenSCG-928-L03]
MTIRRIDESTKSIDNFIKLVYPDEAYQQYIRENLCRPNGSECSGTTGEVVLAFQLDKKGRPKDIQVIQSLCPSLDKEAVRLVKKGPAWDREAYGSKTLILEIRF